MRSARSTVTASQVEGSIRRCLRRRVPEPAGNIPCKGQNDASQNAGSALGTGSAGWPATTFTTSLGGGRIHDIVGRCLAFIAPDALNLQV